MWLGPAAAVTSHPLPFLWHINPSRPGTHHVLLFSSAVRSTWNAGPPCPSFGWPPPASGLRGPGRCRAGEQVGLEDGVGPAWKGSGIGHEKWVTTAGRWPTMSWGARVGLGSAGGREKDWESMSVMRFLVTENSVGLSSLEALFLYDKHDEKPPTAHL